MGFVLRDVYPGLVCDLDGVVYRGATALPHAVRVLSDIRPGAGSGGVLYATNNASRTPGEVAAHLTDLGLATESGQVINSSIAGAAVLTERHPTGAAVLGVGGTGVWHALQDAGLTPVAPPDARNGGPHLVAVLQGYGPAVSAGDLAEVAYAVQAGADWVVTNDDRTLPTDRGVAPGNGTLVSAVRAAVDTDPEVVGKPGPLMYQMAADRLGTDPGKTLGIGDRLETDVAGAHAAGMDALLVLTGVHGPSDLVSCERELRPRYVAGDLRALNALYDEPERSDDGWRIGDLTGTLKVDGRDARVKFEGGDPAGSPTDVSLRIALRVLWDALDEDEVTTQAAVSAVRPWQ